MLWGLEAGEDAKTIVSVELKEVNRAQRRICAVGDPSMQPRSHQICKEGGFISADCQGWVLIRASSSLEIN